MSKTLRDAAQQALDTLEKFTGLGFAKASEAASELRAALAAEQAQPRFEAADPGAKMPWTEDEKRRFVAMFNEPDDAEQTRPVAWARPDDLREFQDIPEDEVSCRFMSNCRDDALGHTMPLFVGHAASPSGWKLVPVEATQDMVRVAFTLHGWKDDYTFDEMWRVMVDAAPNYAAPPPAPVAQQFDPATQTDSAAKLAPNSQPDPATLTAIIEQQRGVIAHLRESSRLATERAEAAERAQQGEATGRCVAPPCQCERDSQRRVCAYWHAAQQTAVPLTDMEALKIVSDAPALDTAEAEWLHVIRAVERHHGITPKESSDD